MYPLVEPRQRPERFLLNRFSPLAESAAFLGLGGFDSAGSVWYPDARRLLGAVPNDGTLINMDPATDWVWSPELGRWATDHTTASSQCVYATGLKAYPFTLAAWVDLDVSDDQVIFSVGDSAGTTYSALFVNAGLCGIIRFHSTVRTYIPTTFAAGWHHMAGVFIGASLARFYYDGKYVGETTENAGTSSTFNRIAVGVSADSTPYGYISGRVSDAVSFSGRAISPGEISALTDPSNVMLEVGGVPLILPSRRVAFPAAVAAGGFQPYWARPSYQIIGGGIA